jgi:hypothetical protein
MHIFRTRKSPLSNRVVFAYFTNYAGVDECDGSPDKKHIYNTKLWKLWYYLVALKERLVNGNH